MTPDGHAGDLVSAHLDGELDAETESWVIDHLAGAIHVERSPGRPHGARRGSGRFLTVDAGPMVQGLLARHRALIRVGAAFVGATAVVLGSLALSASVIRIDVVPDLDVPGRRPPLGARRRPVGASGAAAGPGRSPGSGTRTARRPP